jgi:hypothetical protein
MGGIRRKNYYTDALQLTTVFHYNDQVVSQHCLKYEISYKIYIDRAPVN